MRNRISVASLIGAVLALSGCEESKHPKYEPNQTLRAELFHQCLEKLPAGPKATQYNDWDEVVGACSSAAYFQSLYCYENCPPADTRLARHANE